jgi:hypothetical protein
MRLADDSFHGRVVLSSDGIAIGEITRLFIDPSFPGWRVGSFEVRLRKEAADRAGIHRSLFHAATLEISTGLVQSTGDAVILSVPLDELRPPAPPASEETAPAPP